jgi:hypothetical protein
LPFRLSVKIQPVRSQPVQAGEGTDPTIKGLISLERRFEHGEVVAVALGLAVKQPASPNPKTAARAADLATKAIEKRIDPGTPRGARHESASSFRDRARFERAGKTAPSEVIG